MWCGTEAGSYLMLIDSCIIQLKAQGPSRTCNESKEEEEEDQHMALAALPCDGRVRGVFFFFFFVITLKPRVE